MDYFSIRDVEQLTGIKAHTLRIWEQRYGIIRPHRKASKHRFYDNEDLKRILQVAELNRRGYKISKIARLQPHELRELAAQHNIHETQQDYYIGQLITASQNFDEEEFTRFYQAAFVQWGFEYVLLHIFYPLLERMGVGWMTDQHRPVQEHFATNMIMRKLMVATQNLPPATTGSCTLLVAPPGEQHDLPLYVINYYMRRAGKPTRMLGANTPHEILLEAVPPKGNYHIHLHPITRLGDASITETVQQYLQLFSEATIWVSGPLTADVAYTHERLKLIPSLQALVAHCSSSAKD